MQKILVTGGLGYIGSYFIDNYKDKFQIHVIDTNYFQNNINDLDNITYKDVRQIEKKDLKNIEVIIHMGELSNDPLGDLNKNITKKINNDGTINLLKLADKSDVKKFIYMSSASVYGFSDEIMNETSEVNPLTEYSRAKVANETYIINNEFSFETIILRNSTAFGFSSNLRLDLVVNDLTYNGYFNQSINLLSDGTPKRPIVHIHDICKIIYECILDSRNLDKQIFNVGSEDMNFSIKEIALTVGTILNIDDINFGQKDTDQRSYQLNFEKLNDYFPNFIISYDLENGIKDLVLNFKNYNPTGKENRIKVLRTLITEKKLNKNLFWDNL
tara:strand:- start:53238 stop:54224 length:987 start_codon:yes stop_codon:yes gene_type:complete